MAEELLLKNIARFITLDQEEEAYFRSILKVKKLRRRQYFLQEGDVCRYEAFIYKGCLRSYEIDQKGVEHVIQFAPEDWWMGDLYSFFTNTPSRLNIDALEDSELFIFDHKTIEDLYERVPKFERYFRLLMQNSLIALQQRILSNMSMTAAERYCDFLTRYPKIEQRVPNHQIASFLGIKPESLSRIRREYLRGK